jgi:hypothetical protein
MATAGEVVQLQRRRGDPSIVEPLPPHRRIVE